MDIATYILCKSYVRSSLDGLGALKGEPCTIKSIEEVEGGNKVTFEWTGESGTKQTRTMIVKDGAGVGIGRKNPNVTGAEEFNQYGEYYRAQGTYSHAEGTSYAIGDHSHAEGDNSGAVGLSSHVEGHGNTAQGDYSHAEGWSTNALGMYSHTEGKTTRVTECSVGGHAEGLNSEVDGNFAHAEGLNTKANGKYAHTEGSNTRADGDYSHAGGAFTYATNQSQVAIGEYNDPKTDTNKDYRLGTIVEIGNGTWSARSNIVEVYYDKVNINGDIYKNGQPLFGGLSFVKCTQAEYDAITTPDENTVYIIVG